MTETHLAAITTAAPDPEAGTGAAMSAGPEAARTASSAGPRSGQSQDDRLYKAMDDVIARLSRLFFLLGVWWLYVWAVWGFAKASWPGCAAWDAQCGADWALYLPPMLIAFLGNIGALIWALILIGGAINALIIASEAPPLADMPKGLRWISRTIGQGRKPIYLCLYALAVSVVLIGGLLSVAFAAKRLMLGQ